MTFRGKRLPSPLFVDGVCRKLKMDPDERRFLDLLVQKEKAIIARESIEAIESELKCLDPDASDQIHLDDDRFATISEWYHLPLSYIVERSTTRLSAENLAAFLRNKVTPIQVRDSLARLKRLGIIGPSTKRSSQRTLRPIRTTSDMPSRYIRKFHRQMLMRASESLDEQPVSRRTVSGITLPIAEKSLASAMESVSRFREQFRKKYYDVNSPIIYQLNLQLFELTQTSVVPHDEK